eukprot:2747003-Pyramimonas_sp.AAC.1
MAWKFWMCFFHRLCAKIPTPWHGCSWPGPANIWPSVAPHISELDVLQLSLNNTMSQCVARSSLMASSMRSSFNERAFLCMMPRLSSVS